MYHLTRYILHITIAIIVIPVLNGSDYSRLNDPPITITINGLSMQLTGGLNRPEPQFIDWNNDGVLDCFINDRDGRLQYWEALPDWQFGDRPMFTMVTKFFQYIEIGTWFNFNDFDDDGDDDLLCNTPGTDNVSYYTNVNGALELVNTELYTPSGFSVYGGQIVIPTIADINGDGIVNVLDIVGVVNVILGSEELDLIESYAADMNLDGVINIQDIILIINLILN